MEFLREINNKIFSKNMRYLLIGGYAINKYGYSRLTADIDLLIKKSELSFWKEIIESFGYQVYFETEAFVQFSCKREGCMPIDLMLVDDNTFEKLYEAANLVDFGNTQVRIPSIFHMIALKLNVLKQEQKHRQLKDYNDIIQLILINNLNYESSEFQELCLKYGNKDIYERIKNELK